jgi:hypothetical protein
MTSPARKPASIFDWADIVSQPRSSVGPIAVPDATPVLETIAVLDAIAVLPQTSTAQRSLIAAAPRASVVRAISGPGL